MSSGGVCRLGERVRVPASACGSLLVLSLSIVPPWVLSLLGFCPLSHLGSCPTLGFCPLSHLGFQLVPPTLEVLSLCCLYFALSPRSREECLVLLVSTWWASETLRPLLGATSLAHRIGPTKVRCERTFEPALASSGSAESSMVRDQEVTDDGASGWLTLPARGLSLAL